MMNTNPNFGQPGSAPVRTMQIIHLALLAGQVMFCVVTLMNARETKFDLKYTGDPLFFIVPALAVSCFVVSGFLSKQLIMKAKAADTLQAKLTAYQSALIVQMAPLEGSSLFGIVVFTITSNFFFLAVSGLIILYFITLRPTVQKVTDDLGLSMEETMDMK